MNKYLIILALETLLEQLECSDRDTETLERQARVQEQIDIVRSTLK